MRNLAVIILNYKGWQDSIDCLKSLKQQTYKDFFIVMIDNGSGDDSYQKIDAWLNESDEFLFAIHDLDKDDVKSLAKDKEVYLVKSKENHGFAIGNNKGIKIAKTLGCKDVFLLNNDTVLEADALEKLFQFKKENADYSAMTPQIRYFEPADEIWNCGGYIYPFATRKYLYPRANISTVPQTGFRKITLLTGCALYFDPDECGYLSDKFFFGEEDFEFSLRMRKQKKKMAVVFDSIIYHKVGASRGESKKAIEGVYIHYLNRFIDLKSYYSFPVWFFYILMNAAYGTLMLGRSYNFSLSQSYRLFKKIISDARRLEGVDKQLFQDVFFNKKLTY